MSRTRCPFSLTIQTLEMFLPIVSTVCVSRDIASTSDVLIKDKIIYKVAVNLPPITLDCALLLDETLMEDW